MSVVDSRPTARLGQSPTTDDVAYPLTRPNAPKLSAYAEELAAIEASCWLSNYGPVNATFERRLVETLFSRVGEALTVCNATIGLILALKLSAERSGRGPYVVMPSFTFAAAAHAVLWAGLKPLLVDIDPKTWCADPASEERLLTVYGPQIAALMPYAAFGTCLDLDRYDALSERFGVPVVVDAAASLGSRDAAGQGFGTGSRHTIVFSMHATKAFGVGEAGLIYSADSTAIGALRQMGNFGFGSDRSAILPGLNSKLSEVAALSGLIKLADFDAQIAHRLTLAETYLAELPGWMPQHVSGQRSAYQFMPLLIPSDLEGERDALRAGLARRGVGTGRYFVPPIHQQPYFVERCDQLAMPVTEMICARMMSLPISDFMSTDDVAAICQIVREETASVVPHPLPT